MMFYNEDCVTGAKKHIADDSVDLIISDPPYGIEGDKLHKHYNRNEAFVIDGYIEVPKSEYRQFSLDWIREAARVLRPGGSIYVVSGYSNLGDVLNALAKTDLKEMNHIIWKYNFGVATRTKYVSSHYHILYYVKPGAKHTFNTHCRFADTEKTDKGGSANYIDREDVWVINREYQPGKLKNKNQLPAQLLIKMIQYSSNLGDLVCDFFLGSFSTAKVAVGLNRCTTGFELSKPAFKHQIQQMKAVVPGYLIPSLRVPPTNQRYNQGKPFRNEEKEKILLAYQDMRNRGESKKAALGTLSVKFGRGHWALLRVIEDAEGRNLLERHESQRRMTF